MKIKSNYKDILKLYSEITKLKLEFTNYSYAINLQNYHQPDEEPLYFPKPNLQQNSDLLNTNNYYK